MEKILVVDQGTTSSRAILFSPEGAVLHTHQIEVKQYFPKPGWVEQEPDNIWLTVKTCCERVLSQTQSENILGMGISNQRETTLIWDRETGKCLYNAIVWQDRRTTDYCNYLKSQDLQSKIYEKTGLLLDPYFSATKIHWILQQYPEALERAKQGMLLFGTIDCYLLWRLTNGAIHATDITNASRTLLFNINEQDWDEELLDIFEVPRTILPTVKNNDETFGVTAKEIFGYPIPIMAMMGDQQAAMVGEGCTQTGDAKCTFGTGSFLMINTGKKRLTSKQKLLSTIALKIKGEINYAIEGSVFAAGSIIKWFKDTLGLIEKPQDTETLAKSVDHNKGVYFVPAFTGLGAPYWDPEARGLICGLTRETTLAHIVRAGLEAIAYQTKDLLGEETHQLKHLRVDGGVTANGWLMQFLADILQLPIIVSSVTEATALGVANLVAYNAGLFNNLIQMMTHEQAETMYYPLLDPIQAVTLWKAWQVAVSRTLNH